jgi:hypothetical protein
MRKLDYSYPLSAVIWPDPEPDEYVLQFYYGTVTPTSWDEEDFPVEFSVYTFEEHDIPLRGRKVERKFLKLLNKPVEVIGTEKFDDFGDRYILVKEIRPLEYMEYQIFQQQAEGHFS